MVGLFTGYAFKLIYLGSEGLWIQHQHTILLCRELLAFIF